jgi:hypothetical protein
VEAMIEKLIVLCHVINLSYEKDKMQHNKICRVAQLNKDITFKMQGLKFGSGIRAGLELWAVGVTALGPLFFGGPYTF